MNIVIDYGYYHYSRRLNLTCTGKDSTCYLDFRVSGEDVYFIELETMYGLSENSVVLTLAKSFGINFTDLIKSDIHRGLTRKKGHFGY